MVQVGLCCLQQVESKNSIRFTRPDRCRASEGALTRSRGLLVEPNFALNCKGLFYCTKYYSVPIPALTIVVVLETETAQIKLAKFD